MNSEEQSSAILVIDDEESLRNTFQFFLQNQGYGPVHTASTFEEALLAISKQRYDLIISDIVLGGNTGIDILKRVREMGLSCPVVMITGYPTVETASEAVRLGAFDYIPKPVDKEALLKTARIALRQYQLERGQQKAEQERERYRAFLETVFTSVTDAIITLDQNLDIKEVNPAARLLLTELHPGLLDQGTIVPFCSQEDCAALKKEVLRVLKTGQEGSAQLFECQNHERRKKMLSASVAPLKDGAGGAEGAVVVIRDLTVPEQSISGRRQQFHRFLGSSDAMQSAYTLIENVGRVDLTVLITGESGTGKELAAEALHQESHRRNRPLVKVDCTAIPESLLESELFGHRKGSFTGADRDRMGRILQADGGTLFLDEIGDISPMMQLRLLRFLQESTFYPVGQDTPIRVDVRVLAATNVDLKEKVRAGEFREDLYFRLRVIDVILPPLRDRGNDVLMLANHFIEKVAVKVGKQFGGISDQAKQLLLNYPWPGNVRELEHVIERACVLCEGTTLSADQLPPEIRNPAQPQVNIPTAAPMQPTTVQPAQPVPEQDLSPSERILQALRKSGGNKAKAARILGIDRTTLYRKIRELQLDLSQLDL
ncbi:sigma 54-interacting transcriptional regulator [Desulfobulbus rhabdoformis]|uniref:sigma-54 dependent transcriptional regulator n=1 Tax=Desulfobulbus rhabdoformis TaxID=34032 RepID=UPI00196340D6|nr:sigma-54 dependent transcriptional regulator [Desulfobulbus rhabdoformis]MBM9615503.1 sigma 54-interacting transcriptional regulator [Desulfobulbus rhabdoformis]